MNATKWTILSRLSLLSAPPWLEVFREVVALPNGRRVDDFYTIDLQEYVVVVALTETLDVVMERHYRRGPDQVTLALPAGYIDLKEDPVDAARRELREETGFVAERWRQLGRYVVDGNRGCGAAHMFLAEGALFRAVPDGRDLSDIAVSLVRFHEVLARLRGGEIAELASAAALCLALAERPELLGGQRSSSAS